MPYKILIADDELALERLMLQRFRKQIREGEWQLDFAANGRQALLKLEDELDFDLLLTDINMPEMDGLTLLRQIGEQNMNLKTVVISAYNDVKNIRKAMNLGAFDFLTKPLDFTDLKTTINKALAEVDVLKEAADTAQKLEVTIEEKETAIAEKELILREKKFKERFLANISHDIRTPVTAIMGVMDFLLSDNPLEKHVRYLNAVKKSSLHLQTIINDLLDLSLIHI